MYTYTLGGKKGKRISLNESSDMVVVRTKNARKLDDAVVSKEGVSVLDKFKIEQEFPESDVTVLKAKDKQTGKKALRNKARKILKKEEELRFAGRVLEDPRSKTAVIYTENLFVKFYDNIQSDICEKILSEYNLKIKQKPGYAVNMYFVCAPENTGLDIFDIAEKLLKRSEVELCHPELIRKRSSKSIHSKQWHLKKTTINGIQIDAHSNIEKAHLLSQGENIVIAVIDDGVDIDHAEFNVPGKVVHSRDVTNNNSNPRPRTSGNKHGTACAGVAASSGMISSGVAPKAKLMPIRSASYLGSNEEANSFMWAADHGADIISCSWGPEDGEWDIPDDPAHFQFVGMSDGTRLAIDYATTSGRNGRGCVITFAAGNGNENVENDGYASYDRVIAVAACNDTGKRSIYSDFGDSVWCSFPSNDFEFPEENHPSPKTNGIYTTDRTGSSGYSSGNYTETFGGTSSACPGVAGIAALILSVNPQLTWQQVKEIIKNSCVKIDLTNGQYNSTGHSGKYGYGRPDAEKAVMLASGTLLQNSQPVKIISALVNPAGTDAGNEKISLLNTTSSNVNLSGWTIKIKTKKQQLSGQLAAGAAKTIAVDNSKINLTNTGANIILADNQNNKVHEVSYSGSQVKPGEVIVF